MKRIILFIALFSLGFQLAADDNRFVIHKSGQALTLVCDAAEPTTVHIALGLLADDIERLTGRRPAIKNTLSRVSGTVIFVGTVEKSRTLQQLLRNQKAGLQSLGQKWESYLYRFMPSTRQQSQNMLIIAGSDKRGAAYGIMEISRRLGVSPWYYWADVRPELKTELSIPAVNYDAPEPSVKYRGIFINDECWGLNAWASQTLDPETGNIGPATYKHVFELLLRLKANFIWPAMHPCTNGFYQDLNNPKLANDYGIIVGSSHAEPMLRNNVSEWKTGDFNFFTNREGVLKYWRDRVAESKNYESVYTLGMRGIHDSGMVGASSMEEQVRALSEVIGLQREMLQQQVNSDVTRVPQAFTAYKEVLDVYDAGLKLQDDITLVWPDDNYGYIQRFSDMSEQQRAGGSGVYYHISYWGRPHDYLWISSTHPSLIREEMLKAYSLKSRQLWVVNVGDIKPLEYNTSLFLDMAYDFRPFTASLSEKMHMMSWLTEIFGETMSVELTDILWRYYQLNFERRPEFMGWSQVEPTRKTHFSEYNHFVSGDEAQKRMDAFNSLAARVRSLQSQLPLRLQDAFYQLVYYPVINAGHMNKKFLNYEKAHHYALQGRASANDYAVNAMSAYDSIQLETAYFNEQLTLGKWRGMMHSSPRDLPVFDLLPVPHWRFRADGWGVATEGDEEIRRVSQVAGPTNLPRFSRLTDRSYFLDIFLKGLESVRWTAKPSADWIKVDQTEGELVSINGRKQQRLWVSIDWSKLPDADRSFNGSIVISDEKGDRATIAVSAEQLTDRALKEYPLHVEDNGYVSIFAANFARKYAGKQYNWEVFEGLGYSGSSVWANPLQLPPSAKELSEAPVLEYDINFRSTRRITLKLHAIPVHRLTKDHNLRIAVAFDGEEPQIVDFQTYGRSEEWKLNVLANNALRETTHQIRSRDKHVLKIYALDPGVMLDRLEIDCGGLPDAYGVIDETRNVHFESHD